MSLMLKGKLLLLNRFEFRIGFKFFMFVFKKFFGGIFAIFFCSILVNSGRDRLLGEGIVFLGVGNLVIVTFFGVVLFGDDDDCILEVVGIF